MCRLAFNFFSLYFQHSFQSFFGLTNVQNHFHGFLSTCEGSCVDGEMAKLVLLAKPRFVLYL